MGPRRTSRKQRRSVCRPVCVIVDIFSQIFDSCQLALPNEREREKREAGVRNSALSENLPPETAAQINKVFRAQHHHPLQRCEML